MYCPSCGTQAAEGSARCAKCGASFAGATARAAATRVAQSSALKGFFVLWGTWFTMPIRTLRLTAQQLREVGDAGAFDSHNDIPHLTWVRVAGGMVACIGIFAFIIWGVVKGFGSLDMIDYDTSGAILRLIGYPILGVLLAIVFDWIVMTWMVESLGLMLGISNNIRKIAER